MDEIATPSTDNTDVLPSLRKASLAGGPVTCVCLRPTRRRRLTIPGIQQPLDELARIWAMGPYLYCSCGNDEERETLLVFPQHHGGSIHGISFQGDKLEQFGMLDEYTSTHWDAVVYGGKQLAFCSILSDIMCEGSSPKMKRLEIEHDGKVKSHMTAADWIWDVKLIHVNGPLSPAIDGASCTVVLGLARNTIELWSVDSEPNVVAASLQVTCQRRIPAMPSCLLMSLHIFQQEDRLWVASGTAFQVIQVWTVPISHGCHEEDGRTSNYCLEGHGGAIHSVQFSKDGRYLASTSDDRSVRLWSCDNSSMKNRQSLPSSSSMPSHEDSSNHNPFSVQWVGWGHTARVWGVAFLVEAVVSVAEDATARIWSLELGAPLACVQHSSGLWSVTTWNDMAMFGATDGTVSVYNLARRIPGRELDVSESIPIPDDRPLQHLNSEILSSDSTKKEKQNPCKMPAQVIVGMKWTQMGQIVVATRTGSLMMWNMERQEWNQIHPWWVPAFVESHGIAATDGCCMEVFKDLIAIGTTRGQVVVVRCSSNVHDQESPPIVLAAQSLMSVKGLKWISHRQILVSFHIRSVALWFFGDNESALRSMSCPSITLNLNSKCVPLSCAYDDERKQMLVGDCRGNIALFEIPQSPGETGFSSIHPASSLPRVHQKEHVTAIILVGDKIVSSGNDGCLHTSYRNGSSLQRGLSIPVWSMSGITNIWLGRNSAQFIVAGFYGNKYRVVDASNGHEFFQIDTGGRQRIHDFLISETDLKHMAVCMNQKDGTNRLMIQREVEKCGFPGYFSTKLDFNQGVPIHRETIFDACFFSLGTHDVANFLLTGSEDCGSKIALCNQCHPTNFLTLTPQESCVRAVTSSQIDKTSALLVVGGGKLSLQFFLATTRPLAAPCISSLDDVLIYFLGKGHRLPSDEASIDHRINAAKGVPLDGPMRAHMVVAGDSAGQCHVNIISEDTNVRPPPGLIVQVCARPILCLAVSPIGSRVLLAIGTTAGDVQLYDLPGSTAGLEKEWSELSSLPWMPLATFQAHQMGTNAISLAVKTTDDTIVEVTIFTGGDDQAVSLFLFELRFAQAGDFRLVLGETSFTTTVRDASFSAIKGVAGPFHSDCKYFLSAGYTQRLALWTLVDTPCDGKRRLEVVKNLPADVGDVNALATCPLRDHSDAILATVAGLGIETFCLSI